MKHPMESDLALFAGHDLSLISEWRVGRHVSGCEQCRASVEAFEAQQADVAKLTELPRDIPWNRLASEMKANIRLGLAAGECVASPKAVDGVSPFPAFSSFQTAMAYAGVIVLVVAGFWLQRPAPPLGLMENQGAELAATRDGIELSDAGGSFGLRYGASRDVNYRDINYSADAKGSMGARYVDTSTGYVTVVNVNVE